MYIYIYRYRYICVYIYIYVHVYVYTHIPWIAINIPSLKSYHDDFCRWRTMTASSVALSCKRYAWSRPHRPEGAAWRE